MSWRVGAVCVESRLGNPFEKKKTFSILLRRPRAQARARPRAQARAPAKKDGKYTLTEPFSRYLAALAAKY